MLKSCRDLVVPAAALALVILLAGCNSLDPTRDPGLDLGPDILGQLFELPRLMDEDDLQVVLAADDTQLKVGDTFTWWVKFDNPTDKDLKLKVFADATSEILRCDQVGSISTPIFGANIARMRAGIATHGKTEGLRGKRVIPPQEPQVFESSGTVAEGENGQILIKFPECDIVLPSRGSYEVFVPVRVDWFRTFAVGRRFTIAEETRSNLLTVTVE